MRQRISLNLGQTLNAWLLRGKAQVELSPRLLLRSSRLASANLWRIGFLSTSRMGPKRA